MPGARLRNKERRLTRMEDSDIMVLMRGGVVVGCEKLEILMM